MSDADSRKEIKSIYFDTLNKLKQKNVEVELTCVGEPFFYLNDITLFLESLQENDFNRLSIVTNGSLINDKVLKTLETCKVPFFFLVSLNVPNEQAYNEIMKLSKFQKTLDNILAIHNLGIIINVTFTICRESLKYLNDYLNVFSILKQNNIAIEIRKDYNAVFTNEECTQIRQLQEWAK
jgi:MoaA/NifB/PqqE/SkfB family radical SAM enzyme